MLKLSSRSSAFSPEEILLMNDRASPAPLVVWNATPTDHDLYLVGTVLGGGTYFKLIFWLFLKDVGIFF